MHDIVNSVGRVTGIISEISAAGQEQTAGIEQINQAISQMDQVTQQNAALVEEMAAAASSLKSQAGELVDTVRVFDLGSAQATHHGVAPVAAPLRLTNTAKSTVQGPRKAWSSKNQEPDSFSGRRPLGKLLT